MAEQMFTSISIEKDDKEYIITASYLMHQVIAETYYGQTLYEYEISEDINYTIRETPKFYSESIQLKELEKKFGILEINRLKEKIYGYI